MNPRDVIVTSLTPGTPFNPKGKIYRSVKSLGVITGISEGDIMELLAGDLAALVSCKPSAKGKGLLVALKNQLPAEQVQVVGGPAFNPPAMMPMGLAGEILEAVEDHGPLAIEEEIDA